MTVYDNELGWRMVNLGIMVPRAYICVCCLVSSGLGMNRQGLTYCLPCWEKRQANETCLHEDAPGLRWGTRAG
ncbi:MAG: hypothetical protein JO247_05485 [Chloroflexi bacterium]|nr:hypothetical protein [Chloroflexota bacterium]